MNAYVGERRKMKRPFGGFKAGEIVEVIDILDKNKHYDRKLSVRNINENEGIVLYKYTKPLK